MTEEEKSIEYLQLSKQELVEKLIKCERYLYNSKDIVPAEDINLESFEDYCTVGDLKEMLYKFGVNESKLPVFVERVHDVYFQKNNWTTLKVDDSLYPDSDLKDEFIRAWCPSKQKNGLLIYCHY